MPLNLIAISLRFLISGIKLRASRKKQYSMRSCQCLASPRAVVAQSLLEGKRHPLALQPRAVKGCKSGIQSTALNNLASRLSENKARVQHDGFTLAVTVLQGNASTGSGLTSAGGYTPEPSEQDQLMEIDSKIQQLSVKEFVPSQDSTNLSLSQVRVQSAP